MLKLCYRRTAPIPSVDYSSMGLSLKREYHNIKPSEQAGGTTRNISIPDSSFSGNKGSFSTPLEIPKNVRILLAMSDATGPIAGGTTDLMTVGEPRNSQNCNLTDPGIMPLLTRTLLKLQYSLWWLSRD